MSYEQKSRTLDILPSKQRKKERARERLGSNPNPTPYARAYSPTHPAPKVCYSRSSYHGGGGGGGYLVAI